MQHDKTFRLAVWDGHFDRKEVSFPDSKVTGAQIAEAAGHAPNVDVIILLHLKNGELESLRPTELADLGAAGTEDVFVISGAFTHKFFVNGLSMEWPRATLKARHVLKLARAGEDHELLEELTDQPDRVFEPSDDVRIDGPAQERFKTRRRTFTVIVNTRPKTVDKGVLTFDEVVRLAFPNPPAGPDIQFTIQYTRGPAENPSGALVEGGTVKIKDRMEFDVTQTNRS